MKEEVTSRTSPESKISALHLARLSKNDDAQATLKDVPNESFLSFPAAAPFTIREILTNKTAAGTKRLETKVWHRFLGVQLFGIIYIIAYLSINHAAKLPIVPLFAIILIASALFRPKPQITISDKGFQKTKYAKPRRNVSNIGTSKLQNCRPWSAVRSVRFVKAENVPPFAGGTFLDRADAVVLDWNTEIKWDPTNLKSTDYINISALAPDQREQFFQILSRNIPQEILSPEVLYLQLQTLSGSENATTSEYTKIWLDEYSRRFEISNYVALSPGTRCGNGRYMITMLIRTKINASTYLATDVNKKQVAIKELVAPVDCTDAVQIKILEQFNREASILSRLNHKSIVDIQDHFIEGGRTYIVMDCVPGKNLREYVRIKGSLEPDEVIGIAKQLASVLSYLHQQVPPVLHRDLTPDNMIYGEEDKTVVVLDFGAANVFTVGKTATLVGKQFYMPPEQFRGKTEPASDIYAFGATIAFLLSGKDLPSMGKLPAFENKDINPALIELIHECTKFDAINRPDAVSVEKRLELLSEHSAATKVS